MHLFLSLSLPNIQWEWHWQSHCLFLSLRMINLSIHDISLDVRGEKTQKSFTNGNKKLPRNKKNEKYLRKSFFFSFNLSLPTLFFLSSLFSPIAILSTLNATQKSTLCKLNILPDDNETFLSSFFFFFRFVKSLFFHQGGGGGEFRIWKINESQWKGFFQQISIVFTLIVTFDWFCLC